MKSIMLKIYARVFFVIGAPLVIVSAYRHFYGDGEITGGIVLGLLFLMCLAVGLLIGATIILWLFSYGFKKGWIKEVSE